MPLLIYLLNFMSSTENVSKIMNINWKQSSQERAIPGAPARVYDYCTILVKSKPFKAWVYYLFYKPTGYL